MDLVADVVRLLNREMIEDLPYRPRQLMSGPLLYDGPGRSFPLYRAKAFPFHTPFETLELERSELPCESSQT